MLADGKLAEGAYEDLIIKDRIVGGEYLTPGGLGCLLSHVEAWRTVVEKGVPMLVTEDDVSLRQPEFDLYLPALLHVLATLDGPAHEAANTMDWSWGLLYLGNLLGDVIRPALSDAGPLLWRMSGEHWGTYAYVISPRGAATLLKHIYPIYAQVDSMMINIARETDLPVYMSKRLLVATDNTPVRNSRVQQYEVPHVRIPRVIHTLSARRADGSGLQHSHTLFDLWAAAEGATADPATQMYQLTAADPGFTCRGAVHPVTWSLQVWDREDVARLLPSCSFLPDWALAACIISSRGGVFMDSSLLTTAAASQDPCEAIHAAADGSAWRIGHGPHLFAGVAGRGAASPIAIGSLLHRFEQVLPGADAFVVAANALAPRLDRLSLSQPELDVDRRVAEDGRAGAAASALPPPPTIFGATALHVLPAQVVSAAMRSTSAAAGGGSAAGSDGHTREADRDRLRSEIEAAAGRLLASHEAGVRSFSAHVFAQGSAENPTPFSVALSCKPRIAANDE